MGAGASTENGGADKGKGRAAMFDSDTKGTDGMKSPGKSDSLSSAALVGDGMPARKNKVASTMAPVKTNCGDVFDAANEARAEKRAHSYDANACRRGDIELSEQAQNIIKEKQAQHKKTWQARQRRGSVGAVLLKDEDLAKFHNTKEGDSPVECSIFGVNPSPMQPKQRFKDDKLYEMHWNGAETPVKEAKEALAMNYGFHFKCQKGSKGGADSSPNQDNFGFYKFRNGWELVVVMDGHGPFGHVVSGRAVQTLPFFLNQSANNVFGNDEWDVKDAESTQSKSMEHCLQEAFNCSQTDLDGYSTQKDELDFQASGTTVVVSLRYDNEKTKKAVVYSAWAGDSKWVAGVPDVKTKKNGDKKLTGNVVKGRDSNGDMTGAAWETEDHKPQTESEKARIHENGGEVRSLEYDDGFTAHRIFLEGQDFPGLCMSRSLGDNCLKPSIVPATPDVKRYDYQWVKDTNHPFMLLASDGVWEFLETGKVAEYAAGKLAKTSSQEPDAEKALKKITETSAKQWANFEGDYCDDITCVLTWNGLNPFDMDKAQDKINGSA